MNLKEKRLFLLDMDGTVYLDDELFDGTLDFLSSVKKLEGACILLTGRDDIDVRYHPKKEHILSLPSAALYRSLDNHAF